MFDIASTRYRVRGGMGQRIVSCQVVQLSDRPDARVASRGAPRQRPARAKAAFGAPFLTRRRGGAVRARSGPGKKTNRTRRLRRCGGGSGKENARPVSGVARSIELI